VVDVHHRSRMARLLMRAIIPTARMLLSAGLILNINLQFSLLILVIVGIPVTGLFWVGRRVADTITSRETLSSSVYQEQNNLLSNSWANNESLKAADIDLEATLGKADSLHRMYFRRLKPKAFGQLLLNTGNTLAILLLV